MEHAEQKTRNRRVMWILIGVMVVLYVVAVATILVKN
jgi:flagellar basal body-associated protein FliL